jgi:hypothetical protein
LNKIGTSNPVEPAPARAQELAHLSFNFVLDMADQGFPGLKPLECMLMMAINQANIAPLTRDPAARSRYGALESPAPDDERRPVSVRAVAVSMRLPYETARRRIVDLAGRGVCLMSPAGVVVPEAFMRSDAFIQAARQAHQRLLRLYFDLSARGLLEALPASHYDERDPPVRAAMRLLADYLLRNTETLVSRTGELVSGLVLLPLLAAAAGGDRGGQSVAALSRRVQIPAETARRHIAALMAAGVCRRHGARIALTDGEFATPVWRGLLVENAIAVQRLFAGLAERGVVDAWNRGAADPSLRAEGIG